MVTHVAMNVKLCMWASCTEAIKGKLGEDGSVSSSGPSQKNQYAEF